ncbi:unnamed protein product [Toxocara canis]|uniref:F-box domain-containing protein n=1 Tax=Toxocara canis TaxID=6265 RepID=A0A183TZ95_TOXCA|nr:unnamed protein product [Toxocara canis]
MDGHEEQELIVESLRNSKLNLNSPNSFRIRTKRERKRKKPGTVVLPQAIRSAAVVRRPSSTKYWPLSADNCSLECLPVTVLCDVAACLDISDQNNFAYSCHKAREAVKLFLRSRRNVSVSSIFVRQFPRVDEWKWTSLHNVLDEVAIALRLIPSHSISSLDVRPFYKLHIDDLNLLAIRAQKFTIYLLSSP